MVAFPLSPLSPNYADTTFARHNGVFYPGETVSCTLSQSGATAYAIRDLYGSVVSSGTVTGTAVTPAAPTGGWKLGWYRLYFTGPTNDAVFGFSYGSSAFVILKADSRFITAPAANATSNGGAAAYADLISHAVFMHGPVRWTVDNAVTGTSSGPFSTQGVVGGSADEANWWKSPTYADTVRLRRSLVAFPNGSTDRVSLGNGSNQVAIVFCKDETVDGSKVFLTVTAGTVTGVKMTVAYPSATTIVNTYDNQADGNALAYVTRNDAYVKVFAESAAYQIPSALASTAIGNGFFNGVKSVVTSTFPNITFYEGPFNEPQTTNNAAMVAHQMRLFSGAVKAGNASAQTAGPGIVSINAGGIGWMDRFFAAGGGAYCDAISHHPYNNMTYDMWQGHQTYTAWTALLTRYGLQNKVQWCTENGTVFAPVYGVYKPRRARWYLIQALIMEQYGIPVERHIMFNDTSHGFWNFPTWAVNSGGSVNPQAPLMRTLAEHIYGRPFTSRLNFGDPGDKMYLGSVYRGSDGTGCAVLVGASAQVNGTVTLNVTGSAVALACEDHFGNALTSVTVMGGRVTVSVGDMPVYVTLPSGADVTVYTFNDWPSLSAATTGTRLVASYKASATGASAEVAASVIDGVWQTYYSQDGAQDWQAATSGVPYWVKVVFPAPRTFDRVTIFSGLSWQSSSRLVDFDVQTSPDGISWITVATVTRPTPIAFLHGSGGGGGGSNGTGTQYETYDDEMRIFDLKLSALVVAAQVRVYARAVSYGGEADAITSSLGQGSSVQQLSIQQIGVFCDDTTLNRVASR